MTFMLLGSLSPLPFPSLSPCPTIPSFPSIPASLSLTLPSSLLLGASRHTASGPGREQQAQPEPCRQGEAAGAPEAGEGGPRRTGYICHQEVVNLLTMARLCIQNTY